MTLLYQTKFFPPPIPSGYVVRPQLFEKLDEVLNHKLTLVSAPAGSGKTTLVSAWVESLRKRSGVNFGWLSLYGSDNGVETFLEYLQGCLDESGISFELSQSLKGLDEQVYPKSNISNLFLNLNNLKRDLILILDDYHLIQNKEIHLFISKLLEHASSALHLVLITRSDPPFELARMRLAGKLLEIRMEALRFSDSDAASYLNKMVQSQLAERDVKKLNNRTEGWIAGLQLAAISLRSQADPSAFVRAFTGSHRYVFDYLVEQVVRVQSEEVKTFLMKTSILRRFSPQLCDSVTEANNARIIIEVLEKDNLFLIPLDDERGWFRYHQLFADLLKFMLDQTYPGLINDLYHKASDWYEKQGMIADALDHAMAAEDVELITRLISENVLALVEYSELSPILQRMHLIPFEQRQSKPWLNIAYAWVLAYAGQIDRATEILSEAEANISSISSEESSHFSGHLKVVQGYLAWVVGRQAEALALTQAADALLPKNEIAVRAMNLVTMGNTLNQYSPNLQAVEILEQAVMLAKQAAKPHLLMLAASGLAYALIILGQLNKAFEICEEAIANGNHFKQMSGQALYSTSVIYAELSRIHYEWGNRVEAIQNARIGSKLAKRWAQSDAIVLCMLYEINALISLNEMEEAYSLLQSVRKIAAKVSPWFVANVEQFEIFYWLEMNDPDKAALIVENAAGEIPVSLQARILLAKNNLDEAQDLLIQWRENREIVSAIENCRILLIQALISYKKNDLEKALIQIEKALDIGQDENLIQIFNIRNSEIEKLLKLATKKTIYPEFTLKVLTQLSTQSSQVKIPREDELLEPFSDRELQILSLLNSPYSTPEIAKQLFLSANTVRTHIKNIYSKLNVHGRSEAVSRGKELRFI